MDDPRHLAWRSPGWIGLGIALLAGCGSPPAPENPDPGPLQVPATTATVAPTAAKCATWNACLEAGKKAEAAGDLKAARTHYERGCSFGATEPCIALADMAGVPEDERIALLTRACDLGSPPACFNAAEKLSEDETQTANAIRLYSKACGAFERLEDAAGEKVACKNGADLAYEKGQHATALELAKRNCDASNSAGCGLLGVMYAKGEGVGQNVQQAQIYLATACKAGDQEACDNEKKLDAAIAAASAPPPATGGLDVPGANITMSSVTVDGLTMTDFSCKAGGGLGALLAGPTMAGMLAKKKAALKACSPKGGTARVRWTAASGKVTKAESKAASPQIEACLNKTVSSVSATMDGTCAASVDLSK